jgi:histone-lysine N-methyltransferase SETMAR
LLFQDKAASYKAAITHQKLADLDFEVLKHRAYTPDLAPSDYYIFPNNKEQHLKGRKFSNIGEASSAADGRSAAQPKEIFLDVLKKLEERSRKCVELRGDV